MLEYPRSRVWAGTVATGWLFTQCETEVIIYKMTILISKRWKMQKLLLP